MNKMKSAAQTVLVVLLGERFVVGKRVSVSLVNSSAVMPRKESVVTRTVHTSIHSRECVATYNMGSVEIDTSIA